MGNKLKEEEEKHIRLLLSSKPKPDQKEIKKFIDKKVKELYNKYKKSNKLF